GMAAAARGEVVGRPWHQPHRAVARAGRLVDERARGMGAGRPGEVICLGDPAHGRGEGRMARDVVHSLAVEVNGAPVAEARPVVIATAHRRSPQLRWTRLWVVGPCRDHLRAGLARAEDGGIIQRGPSRPPAGRRVWSQDETSSRCPRNRGLHWAAQRGLESEMAPIGGELVPGRDQRTIEGYDSEPGAGIARTFRKPYSRLRSI